MFQPSWFSFILQFLRGRFILSSEKGVANGVATLDENGLLKQEQLPAISPTLETGLTGLFTFTVED